MPQLAHLIAAAGLAVTATLVATPLAIAVAGRTQFQDLPAGYKEHASPTPYLGGSAVLIGFLLAAFSFVGDLERLGPIIGGAACLWLLGTIDDRRSLSPVLRLGFEVAIAVALWALDLGWAVFGSPALDLMASVVWIVALVNAFNLMDNMDGAAGTVGAVTAIATATLALIVGDLALAVLSAGLAGACLGFLPYNLARPSKIFLGDGGSLPIGFVLGASLMAIPASDELGWTFPLAAVLLAGLPVLDTVLVITSRRRARVPLMTGGRDHLTHRLVSRLGSPRSVALTLGCCQAGLGAAAIGVVELGKGSVIAGWSVWFLAGAAAVVALERDTWAPPRERLSGATDEARAPRSLPPGRRGSVMTVEAIAIAFVVVSCGLSPFLYGFYDVSLWAPITLVVLAALLGLVIARPAAPRGTALAAIAGLTFIWFWSFASTRWAESAAQALTDSNRWLLYAALLGLLVLLLRDDRVSRIVTWASGAAVLGFGVYLMARLIGGSGSDLFLGRRLNEPLGYVNGQAGYLLLGFWPLVALAERAERPWLAGAGVAGATVLAGLAVLGQTRAVVPAVALSALILIAVVPGRARRFAALLVVLAGLIGALPSLLEVYNGTPSGRVPDDATIATAAAVLGLSSTLAGVVWAVVSRLWVAGRRRDAVTPLVRRAAVLAPVVAAIVGLAVMLGTTDAVDRLKTEYRNFVELRSTSDEDSRFTSGSGHRYDYWRIAAEQFANDPLRGVGAGNYDRTYFIERRTAEDIRQAHSIEMQMLGELGLPGLAALALFLIAVFAGFARRARAARASLEERVLAVAAGGAFLVWLLHTSVDWLHLIPGVTGIALAFASVLVGPWQRPSAVRVTAGRRALALACTAVIVAGAVLVGRAALADRYESDARDLLESSPAGAIAKADDALALDDEALETYYVKAAGYAALNRYEPARATLLEATRREPHDFVTWALLGDLAVRRGDVEAARAAYREAARLNPRGAELRELARRPMRQ